MLNFLLSSLIIQKLTCIGGTLNLNIFWTAIKITKTYWLAFDCLWLPLIASICFSKQRFMYHGIMKPCVIYTFLFLFNEDFYLIMYSGPLLERPTTRDHPSPETTPHQVTFSLHGINWPKLSRCWKCSNILFNCWFICQNLVWQTISKSYVQGK